MKWLRLYQDVLRNPKVQDLRPELFKFWINFLCAAGESRTRGTIESEAHLRRALGLAKPLVKRYCDELENLALLVRNSDGSLTPHDWDDYQRESDDVAKRQKDKRARDSVNGPPQMSRDMSRDVSRDCSVTVTPRARSDADADAEREEIPAASLAAHGRACTGEPAIFPGPHPPLTEAAGRELEAIIWDRWQDHRLCRGFRKHQRALAESQWRAAIAEVAAGGTVPHSVALFRAAAADIAARGGAPSRPGPARTAGRRPTVLDDPATLAYVNGTGVYQVPGGPDE